MYIYETKLSKKTLIPTQLDFFRVADQRGLLKASNEKSLYKSLEAGAHGEQFMVEMLKKHGREHWVLLRNLWLDCQGVYESDLILLTRHTPYVFEVKNYDGLFEYKDHRCYMNGNRMKENCIHQTQKGLINLQNMCSRLDHSIVAKGALLMVGEHNDVRIESPIEEIECKKRNQIRNYIQDIARLENQCAYSRKLLDIRGLLNHFEKNETLNPFGPHKSYSPEEVLEGQLGIHCRTCGTYELETSRKFVKCKNNHEELRLEAIIRTIHEFGLLTFDHDFMTRNHLSKFMDQQASDSYLVRTLNRHFTKIHHGKYAKYKNKKALY